MSEPVQNLFTLMKVVSDTDAVDYFMDKYNNCTIRYNEMKKQLAEDIVRFASPIREKILAIYDDKAYLGKVVREGAEKARISASKTLREVREIIGFKTF